jgi:AcrR family transcriptional regulator
MGRVAGVTAAETRDALLLAAAEAFARQGYDGTRVADIAAIAGVSNGALYAHFDSKAALLVAALRAHGRRLLAELFAADPARPVAELLLVIGRRLPRRPDASGYLLVEALATARRDEEVARPMRDYVGERVAGIAELMHVAQGRGELDPSVSAEALAHFCFLLAMGSALVPEELHPVDANEWDALLTRLMAALAPPGAATPGAQAQETEAQEEGPQ